MIQTEPHILIVDDDERIRSLLRQFLLRNGFLCTLAQDAQQARILLLGLEFDLIVLDVMMPGEDGLSLTGFVRKTIKTPILLLSAKGETDARIVGLEAGADDYLAKPFDPKELILRINAILKRVPLNVKEEKEPLTILQLGEVTYDIARSELWHGDRPIKLTATEAILMRIFATAPNETIARERLVNELAFNGAKTQERAIDVQITRLRRKIEHNPRNPKFLQTIRGAGYMLALDESQ